MSINISIVPHPLQLKRNALEVLIKLLMIVIYLTGLILAGDLSLRFLLGSLTIGNVSFVVMN